MISTRLKQVSAAALLGAVFFVNAGVASALQQMPMTTTSYYVTVGNTETDTQLENWMYQKGYALGQQTYSSGNASDNAVVLDFGQPTFINGVYGASGFKSPGNYISTNSIGLAALYFAYGYYNALGPSKSTPLRIIIGTSNLGLNSWTDTNAWLHGQAWVTMVKNVQSSLQYYGWSNKVAAYGGSDMELGYATAARTTQWVNGYRSLYTNYVYLFDFGDAGGCPKTGTTKYPTTCTNGWTQENVWYAAGGAGMNYPLPEIYATSGANAQQWQQLSLYSSLAHGWQMYDFGTLSQYQACNQRTGQCSGINNAPSAAWTQLWNTLNGDYRTSQNLLWSTDIAWRS